MADRPRANAEKDELVVVEGLGSALLSMRNRAGTKVLESSPGRFARSQGSASAICVLEVFPRFNYLNSSGPGLISVAPRYYGLSTSDPLQSLR